MKENFKKNWWKALLIIAVYVGIAALLIKILLDVNVFIANLAAFISISIFISCIVFRMYDTQKKALYEKLESNRIRYESKCDYKIDALKERSKESQTKLQDQIKRLKEDRDYMIERYKNAGRFLKDIYLKDVHDGDVLNMIKKIFMRNEKAPYENFDIYLNLFDPFKYSKDEKYREFFIKKSSEIIQYWDDMSDMYMNDSTIAEETKKYIDKLLDDKRKSDKKGTSDSARMIDAPERIPKRNNINKGDGDHDR